MQLDHQDEMQGFKTLRQAKDRRELENRQCLTPKQTMTNLERSQEKSRQDRMLQTPSNGRGHQSIMTSNTSQFKVDDCAICCDAVTDQQMVKVLPCGHYFHNDCINQWLIIEKRCPMCMVSLVNPDGCERAEEVNVDEVDEQRPEEGAQVASTVNRGASHGPRHI